MPAYFCEKTGVRIAAPGVSKSVDPVNGQDEITESESEHEDKAAPAAHKKTKSAHRAEE